jgi:hypothetical protein
VCFDLLLSGSDCGDTVPVRRFFHALRFSAYGRQDTPCARPNPEYRHQYYERPDSDESDEHEYRSVLRFFLAMNPCPIEMFHLSLVSGFAVPEGNPAASSDLILAGSWEHKPYTFSPSEAL